MHSDFDLRRPAGSLERSDTLARAGYHSATRDTADG